jgi:hypothetical protein
MVEFEGGPNFNGSNSPTPLLVSITPVNGAGNEVADFLAPVAVKSGVSFGNQGLESSDMTNPPNNCGGDWCNLFAQNPPTSSSPIRELQTLGQSCPPGTTCANSLSQSTGPLDALLPFATTNGANDLELYYQDWLIAYDPTNLLNSVSGAAYSGAIQSAFVSGAQMQVLFPDPSNGDVATYLMNNPFVTGVVVSVDWSDIEPTQGAFNFNITNSLIQPWLAAHKNVNLVLENTTYGGGNCPPTGSGSNGTSGTGNCAMPSWMWTVLQ